MRKFFEIFKPKEEEPEKGERSPETENMEKIAEFDVVRDLKMKATLDSSLQMAKVKFQKKGRREVEPDKGKKEVVDPKLRAEFERVLAEHKAAMAKQKDSMNENLAHITSEGLTNRDMELFLEIVTNRVGLIREFERYKDDLALKHPLLNEVRQMKISIEKEIGVSHVEKGKSNNRFELYSYLSHLLSIAAFEAAKSRKLQSRQESQSPGDELINLMGEDEF